MRPTEEKAVPPECQAVDLQKSSLPLDFPVRVRVNLSKGLFLRLPGTATGVCLLCRSLLCDSGSCATLRALSICCGFWGP
jgi:hypothetical protein